MRRHLGACLLALILFAPTGGVNAEDRTIMLIDDFSRADGRSALDVPFAAFRGESLRAPLDPTRLERVAIAAAKWEGAADVAIARIALYR
jgi:hypothetical protein